MPFRIVVLGGYGHFGGRIARALAQEAPIALCIAGRHGAAAAAFTAQLGGGAHGFAAVALLYILTGLCWIPVVVVQYRLRDLAAAAESFAALPPAFTARCAGRSLEFRPSARCSCWCC